MYVKVNKLHPVLRDALDSVEYRRTDISVEARETASMFVGGGDGSRGFAILCDLDGGRFETHWGSWGGANQFNPRNPVDLDSKSYQLPENGAVITGAKYGSGSYANITVHPNLMARMLPEKAVELSQVERDALYCYRSIKGGSYRREELSRRRVTEDVLVALVKRGLLKEDARGFRQITTEGRNAVGDYRGY